MTLMVLGQMVDGQCGIGCIRSFRQVEPDRVPLYVENHGYSPIEESRHTSFHHKGGTGMFGSGFINTTLCKEVYEALNKRFKMVSITPVRHNKNSSNMFFYAMWDDKENTDVTYITPPPWPFDVKKEEEHAA